VFGTHLINALRREVLEARQLGQYRLIKPLGAYGSSPRSGKGRACSSPPQDGFAKRLRVEAALDGSEQRRRWRKLRRARLASVGPQSRPLIGRAS